MTFKRATLAFSVFFALGLTALPAANVTYSVTGKLGPVLSGKDPLKADGKAGSVKIVASETLSPKSHTSTSATYSLPAGAVTGKAAGHSFKSSGAATMKISLGSMDNVTVSGPVSVDGVTATVSATMALKKGSFTSAVLKHPAAFKPASQSVTPAKTAKGPGSKVSYKVGTSATVLGVTGKATSK